MAGGRDTASGYWKGLRVEGPGGCPPGPPSGPFLPGVFAVAGGIAILLGTIEPLEGSLITGT